MGACVSWEGLKRVQRGVTDIKGVSEPNTGENKKSADATDLIFCDLGWMI